MAIRYVGLPEPGTKHEKRFLYEADRKTRVRHVLWGDFLNVEAEEPDGWLKVVWAPRDPIKRRELYIPGEHAVEQRPLEIVFLDVGQGDGAVLITPERGEQERVIVIDAGQGDNMNRFLNGRFQTYHGGRFDAAVITHPDEDHYGGFLPIFKNPEFGFGTIYHSGLVERPVAGTFAKLGGLSDPDAEGVEWLTDLPQDDQAIEDLFGDPASIKKYKYPAVMHAAVTNPRVEHYRMLSTDDGTPEDGRTYMPDFAPSDGRDYTIEVLGPFVEQDGAGAPALRRIKSYGETKNGHSVLLRLRFGQFALFFGGDLNAPAEEFLIESYGGEAAARERFGADVMKVCHHGSEKVTDKFSRPSFRLASSFRRVTLKATCTHAQTCWGDSVASAAGRHRCCCPRSSSVRRASKRTTSLSTASSKGSTVWRRTRRIQNGRRS
jgi:beta-lactamase superfamily II metal-dependent hydrolase